MFNWKVYLNNNPDLKHLKTQQQAVNHYNRFGKKEGRKYTTVIQNINPVIVCIAKLESDYIKSFVDYHIALGFEKIFLYDNEDTPVYDKLNLDPKVKIIHFPGNNFHKGVQYMALDHFSKNFINQGTHVAHIDIDEYITLKKHKNIKEFIKEYFYNDCAGIGMNWRFFGSNGLTEKSNIPDPIRFTHCDIKGNMHIKTIFEVSSFIKFKDCHSIQPKKYKYIKNTNGDVIKGPFNNNIYLNIIQLNHYKCKTLSEFKFLRSRGRADLNTKINEDVIKNFNLYNKNEIEELTCYNFFKANCVVDF